ncbi:MAG: SDR family oxidoreductase [Planctomycetes bacterium]|nr:SDR family oxidoreductase [Planctomycetota bacterium]
MSTTTKSLAESISLAGRHALVGGATQGIGFACAKALAEAGASVTIVGRDAAGLASALTHLPMPLGKAQVHRSLLADYADWKAVAKAVTAHVAEHGTVHIVVHNTGGPAAGPIATAAPEDLIRGFEMHVLTGQAIVQACVPGMREAKFGRIVNITSTSVVTPIRGLGVSNTIRAAVANWSRTLAGELGASGITANTVLPGFTKTARLDAIFKGRAAKSSSTVEAVERDAIATIPAGRLGDASEIAAAVLFLASPAASYVNGINLPVDGGRLAMQS